MEKLNADGEWPDEKDKVLISISHSPYAIRFGLVAPALLITENESNLWEVVWLNRSSGRSLCL
jgi:hypothetical protein